MWLMLHIWDTPHRKRQMRIVNIVLMCRVEGNGLDNPQDVLAPPPPPPSGERLNTSLGCCGFM